MEYVYNMDETYLLYCAQSNKTLVQGKVCGHKMQKDNLIVAFVVNTTNTDMLNFVIIYISLHRSCLERWLPTYYVWWFAHQSA